MSCALNRQANEQQRIGEVSSQRAAPRMEEPRESLIRHLQDTQVLAKLVGQSPLFLKAIEQIPTIAKDEATVLINGETGTGKELIARAIHYFSNRAPFPFVAINCGSLPETLMEDELFGHERGAFTDAHIRRSGLLAQAEKGTLFLDEVATLTAKAQVTLLRVLQNKKFRILGSRGEQEANVRVVAATNAPLYQLVQAGGFRADLYYRLCVFSINLPPLRDRKEDIFLLALHFLKKYGPADGEILQLAPSARKALMSHSWPGNVRELENAFIRGIRLCRTDSIEDKDLGLLSGIQEAPDGTAETFPRAPTLKVMKQKAIEAFERDYLIQLLCEHQGNVSHAAHAAGKERRDLGKLLKKYRLEPKLFHPPVRLSP